MNSTIGTKLHGRNKYRPYKTPQEIEYYRLKNPPALVIPLEPESPFDIRGNVKPQSRAWMSGKTIWFTLFRIGKPGHITEGQWTAITRTMHATTERRKMVRRVLKAREQVAEQMLDAGREQQARPILPNHEMIDALADLDIAQIKVAELQQAH
jgi:hypothetical protein